MGDDRETSEGRGTVFVSEETTFGAENWATGQFSAHWEAADGSGMRQGPEDVSIDAALSWAREQADRVLVMSATEEQYSAGTADVAGVAPWPVGGVVFERRTTRSEWYARLSESSGSYVALGEPAHGVVQGTGHESRGRTEELRLALEETPAVSNVSVSVKDGEGWEANCVVTTAHSGEAVEILQAVLEDLGDVGAQFASVSVSDHPI